MYLHLADTSNERGQYRLLLEERYRSVLMSYAYVTATEKCFSQYWEGMYGVARGIAERGRVLIDSGAFTAFTGGKVITPGEYADWALDFRRRWEQKLSWLRFFNLDVIGDQAASWRNQVLLESRGLRPIPIITYGADLKNIDRALAEYEYFALGGLVPLQRQRARLQGWLDTCFRPIVAKFQQTGVMPKIHLLGLSQDWILSRYPAYSVDSSTWMRALRYGLCDEVPGGQVPPVKQGLELNLFAVRQRIRKYRDMEARATSIWGARGVQWDG